MKGIPRNRISTQNTLWRLSIKDNICTFATLRIIKINTVSFLNFRNPLIMERNGTTSAVVDLRTMLEVIRKYEPIILIGSMTMITAFVLFIYKLIRSPRKTQLSQNMICYSLISLLTHAVILGHNSKKITSETAEPMFIYAMLSSVSWLLIIVFDMTLNIQLLKMNPNKQKYEEPNLSNTVLYSLSAFVILPVVLPSLSKGTYSDIQVSAITMVHYLLIRILAICFCTIVSLSLQLNPKSASRNSLSKTGVFGLVMTLLVWTIPLIFRYAHDLTQSCKHYLNKEWWTLSNMNSANYSTVSALSVFFWLESLAVFLCLLMIRKKKVIENTEKKVELSPITPGSSAE